MFRSLLIVINVAIFAALSGLHVYWVLGGRWALHAAIPDAWNDKAFDPSGSLVFKFATVVVAIGLSMFAAVTASHLDVIETGVYARFLWWATCGITAIFAIRAVGDFKHCGFFKSTKDGLFAERDSRIYSPLCLYLALSLGLILFLQRG